MDKAPVSSFDRMMKLLRRGRWWLPRQTDSADGSGKTCSAGEKALDFRHEKLDRE
jgi:hypothetical protein